jgi:hypothetical protein
LVLLGFINGISPLSTFNGIKKWDINGIVMEYILWYIPSNEIIMGY